MGYVLQRVEVYQKESSGWASTSNVISTASGIRILKGLGNLKDTFSFVVPNGRYFMNMNPKYFKEENLVKIFLWRDRLNYVAGDLQIMGVINAVDQSWAEKGDALLISGNDFTETFFDVELPIDQRSKTWTEIFQHILEQLSEKINKTIIWDSSNPTLKHDNTSFPKTDLILNYTPVYQMFEKLLQNEFTGDGQYIMWLEPSGTSYVLKTAFKSNAVAGIITQGTNTSNIKISKSKDGIINFVVFNCGDDLYTNPIENFYYDNTSSGKIGFKTYYATEETKDLFVNLWNTERNYPTKKSFFSPDSNGRPTLNFPDSYDYTFIDGTTVSSDESFNTHLVDMALTKGEDIAKSLVNLTANPRYATSFERRFTNDFTMGELYQLDFAMRNINKQQRINEITQQITGTNIVFIEDETTASFDS